MKAYDVYSTSDFHPEIGLLISTWRDGTREWRDNLGKVSQEAIAWQPYPGGYSIGAVMMHMLAWDMWWISERVIGKKSGEQFKMFEPFSREYPTPPNEPVSWYFELMDSIREELFEGLKTIAKPDEVFERKSGNYTYTPRWVLAHLTEHDSYHGGQLVLLNEMWKAMNSNAK